MRFPPCRLAMLVLALAPVLAHAGMYKCVGPNGAVSFSDRPCEARNGEKAADIKDDAGFAAVLARDHAKNIAQSCMALTRRIGQCRAGLDATLLSNLREHCRPPVARFRQALRQSRDSDEDSDRGYNEPPPQEARCDVLQAETWAFVKANFSGKISEQDLKTIEYNIAAVPSDGRTPDLSVRRKNRN